MTGSKSKRYKMKCFQDGLQILMRVHPETTRSLSFVQIEEDP